MAESGTREKRNGIRHDDGDGDGVGVADADTTLLVAIPARVN